MPNLGVRVEDRGKGQESVWKFEDREFLLKEISEKKKAKLMEEEKKRERKELELKKVPLP